MTQFCLCSDQPSSASCPADAAASADTKRLSDLNEYLSRYRLILGAMIRGMTSAPLNDSISHNLIVQMIPHHRAAVEMSRNLLRYGSDPRLLAIASDIIAEQTAGIAQMKRLLPECENLTDPPRQLCLCQIHQNRLMENMFAQMTYAGTADAAGTAFLEEMIPHHEGAVCLSENALRYHICSGLAPVLRSIIVTRQQGIRRMRRLLKEKEQ